MDYNIIFIILLTLTVFFFFTWYQISHVYIVSKIDGRTYRVKNNHLAQECADTLATINHRIMKLIKYVEGLKPKPMYANRLGKYNPDAVTENILNLDTTYTLNKSDMYFCLTPRKDDIYVYDINTLMFVAIHELAHVSSVSIGHTDEFKDNFADLVNHGIVLGVYNYIDYSKTPVEYCGVTIKHNII